MSAVQQKIIYNGRIVRLELLENKWEVVRHADTVAVLALNAQGEMLLVKQYRIAIDAYTLEAPAGLIDTGESAAEAAHRELREETGFDASLTLLTRFYISPGFCDEHLYIFKAEALIASKLPADEDEDLEVLWLSPYEVLRQMQNGEILGSAATMSTALFAVQHLEGKSENTLEPQLGSK